MTPNDTALRATFRRRLAHLPQDDQFRLIRAYEEWERGHVEEGYRALGMAWTGQTSMDLKAEIERRIASR